MNEPNEKELRDLLKRAVAPVKDTGLRRDLWPEMRKRLDREQREAKAEARFAPARVPWFDWALAALAGAILLLFPGVIPALAYHL